MSRVIGYLIDGSHERGFKLSVWAVVFLVLLGLSTWLVSEQVASSMRAETQRSLAGYEQLRANLLSTFTEMDRRLTQPACSPAYLQEMRRIAFLPDGINELLYAPNGVVRCSVNSGVLDVPKALGAPDIASDNAFDMAFWLDIDLDFLGLPGLTGTLAQRGNLAMIIPKQPLPTSTPRWMDQELVFRFGEDVWKHREGRSGIYAEALQEEGPARFAMLRGVFYQVSCDTGGIHCVAGRSTIGQLFSFGWLTVAVALLVCGLVAAWVARQVYSIAQRYWSFEERFLRHFEKGSVICAYQPLLDLKTNIATGCEVLARWKDVDGTIVPPDRFLPIIEAHGLTERFTGMVVGHAYADLSMRLPKGIRLQVNFNIFPQDLDASRLIPLFAPLLSEDSPFKVVVEIVETAEINPETAQVEIERLRAADMHVYLDDFGAGYSSMHNLAALSIDGVKLDRSFAMAPHHSVLSRMLDHAIDLVQASGRSLVVEGVETKERLNHLRASGVVDFAQGFGISRPLLIDAYVAYLGKHGPRPSRRPTLVA
ncbi:sensor c-di-GMP phosphodiesterase, contains CSS-motif sensor and EAL domain [Devosia lucknowensis]|uniref:cyclic-guanylate-specific phosphodiesterase n=1 Tax=Devosia lucknowensis TaxID=1096929 RepID=A0A1Y6E7V2_9HYPH|nr:EAL domain-containing protein [Devosia lucknowensis]SMQ58725.1 sensor c-di-GMP phosphodiesterase, contains CSS-motif sensor and EAL domain [Devosia lucknowensis]